MSSSHPTPPAQAVDSTPADEYVTEEDTLEVEEVDELEVARDDDDMQPDDDDDGHDDARDGGDELLDNGFDDSVTTFDAHTQAIFAVALHPLDPTLAISGGEDDLAYLWRTDSGEQVAQLTGHDDSVTSVGFSFDGELVATGGMDGRVRVWRRVKGTTDFTKWEFLTNLEGPDEVNVSLSTL